MEYHNRLPPEGINVSRVHPLKQFFQLAAAALLLVVLVAVLLQFTGSFLARQIPFSVETAIMERLDVELSDEQAHPQMNAYLNDLAARLSANLPVPEGMSFTVHYDEEDVFNAFATVGGHLLFYRGLLSSMESENTLAMVMAHELSHVLHRDPVASMGGGVASSIALLALTGSAGTSLAGNVLNSAGVVTGIQFTRKMEVDADRQALAALNATYGHVQGAAALFEQFSKARSAGSSESRPQWMERFFSTHPLDADRIRQIGEIAEMQGWLQEGELTPLPADFKLWLADDPS